MLPAVLVLSAISFWISYELRFDFSIPSYEATQRNFLIPYVCLVKTAFFYLLVGRHSNWRYIGMADLLPLVIQATLSSIFLYTPRYIDAFFHVARGVVMIDFCLYLLLVFGFLGSLRLLREKLGSISKRTLTIPRTSAVMIGAGDAGEMLLREMERNPNSVFKIEALFDDDKRKEGSRIHGCRVKGTVEDIPAFVDQKGIRVCIVAAPSLSGKEMRRIFSILTPLGLEIKTLPSLNELLDRQPSLKQIRNMNICDLLGRQEVRIDSVGLNRLIEGKRVVVTGAGGSIGSELCRQIWKRNPRDLILLEWSENNLFHIHRKLVAMADSDRIADIHPTLCNITDYSIVSSIFHQYSPELVFHAAAHKHVPLQEVNAEECFRNNICGIQTMVRASHETNVERFLLISTDKAVNPVNVMGATKRACELYSLSYSAISRTKFMVVRFGNVLGSEGSVVPIFLEQIASGGPVTVTHPDVTRYFMSIPEAVALVLQATAIGKSGQLMMLDMGEPIKIVDLAKHLISLSGNSQHGIGIEITGLRAGEKLTEELWCDWETCLPTDHEKIRIFRQSVDNPETMLKQINGWVTAALHSENGFDARDALKDIVPEYQPSTVVSASVPTSCLENR
jgi:FlaA1/EpsC-like NDP-sugar epimerase